jgi:hypothetical protein
MFFKLNNLQIKSHEIFDRIISTVLFISFLFFSSMHISHELHSDQTVKGFDVVGVSDEKLRLYGNSNT